MVSNGNGGLNRRETIGVRLRRLRTERDLSQRELAEPGVSYAYISRIEAGTRQPSVKALRKLASKLGVTTSYLETGIDTDFTLDDLHVIVDGMTSHWLYGHVGEDGVVGESGFRYEDLDESNRETHVQVMAVCAKVERLIEIHEQEILRANRKRERTEA
jgi:transcriptional regulator with XRE-family HTH domain